MTPDQTASHVRKLVETACPLIDTILSSAKQNHPDPQSQLIVKRAASGVIPLQVRMTLAKANHLVFEIYAETDRGLFFLGSLDPRPEMAH